MFSLSRHGLPVGQLAPPAGKESKGPQLFLKLKEGERERERETKKVTARSTEEHTITIDIVDNVVIK